MAQRLHVISDLHVESDLRWRRPGAWPDADVVVVAGDVANSCADAVAWLSDALPERDVVFVPGNHDHFGQILQDSLDAGRKAAEGSRVRLLQRDACVIGGVRFLGCTLWTDYRLDGAPKPSMVEAGRSIPDHGRIRIREDGGHISRFMPWHAAAEHRKDLAFLVEALKRPFDGPTVVVTHHAPSGRSIAAKFGGSALNPAFASHLEWLIEQAQPALWVHGHLHDACDYLVGATRVLCNPLGHPSRFGRRGHADGFDPNRVVVV